MRLLNTLEKDVILILSNWSDHAHSGYDGMWFGYSQLVDEINEMGHDIDFEKDIKTIVKNLNSDGFLSYEPTYNDDGQLNGKGYFVREPPLNESGAQHR